MKILWIVNTIFPYPACKIGVEKSVFGGWLNSLFNELTNNQNISSFAIATVYNGKKFLKFIDNKVVYYLIPTKNSKKYDSKLNIYWKKIKDEFQPDIVHIHGTEYPFSLGILESSEKVKSVVSIQGLVSIYAIKIFYNAGISIGDMLKNITLRDILKRDLLITQHKDFKKRGKYEKEILKKCDYIIGRTIWDKSYVFEITKQEKYLFCNESLREIFFKKNWDIKNILRHSIFVSQATYPIKGFHKLLFAANILKEKYPDLKIFVAGNDIIKSTSKKYIDKLKLSGYGKYLRNLIKKFGLEKNVKFVGLLDEEKMCDMLIKSHVFVQASSIENSPNSLGEAMLVGMPCVASYVGGTSDLLLDKKEGFLYPFNDYQMLAEYISNIFENDNLAIELGKNAHIHAKKTHDIKMNSERMLEIYKFIEKQK